MKIKNELERQREIEEMENGMGKRNYVEILSVRTPAGIENNYQDIVGMVLPITGNAYHGIRVVTPNGTERDIFHYNTKINPSSKMNYDANTLLSIVKFWGEDITPEQEIWLATEADNLPRNEQEKFLDLYLRNGC